MRGLFKHVSLGIALAMVFWSACTSDKPVAITEVTNRDCVGIIYNEDITVASGALVRLIPVGYDPLGQSPEEIDSAFTDSTGHYFFDVAVSGLFNIIAKKGDFLCMRDSVEIRVDSTIFTKDTLGASAKLTGRITVKPGDDASLAVIKIAGIDIFTSPSDTEGNFLIPLLPRGRVAVNIISVEKSYQTVDTTLMLLPGTITDLQIRMPTTDAPTVKAFKATFDSSTMYANIQWAASDTSAITMYVVYRVSSSGNDTMILVNKSLTSCTDDLVLADGDSVIYQIAAIGKNNREGYRTESGRIVVCGKVYCVGKIDLTTIIQPGEYIRQIYSDKGDALYLLTDNAEVDNIMKISPQGNLIKKFQSQMTGERMVLGEKMQHDDSGNLYILAQYFSDSTGALTRSTILKFDADLNKRAEYSLSPFLDSSSSGMVSIMITGGGSAYLIVASNHAVNHHSTVMLLAPDFSGVDTQFTIERPLYALSRYGDTIIIFEYYDSLDGDMVRSFAYVSYYDTAFSQLTTSGRPILDKKYWIPSFRERSDNDELLIGAPHGIKALLRRDDIRGNDVNAQLLFTNAGGELLARTVFPAYPSFYFDTAGHLYCCSYVEYDVLDKPETLFIYTMAPLYAKPAGNLPETVQK